MNPPRPGNVVKWALAGLALVIAVLLASCSAPPPEKQITPPPPARPAHRAKARPAVGVPVEKQEPKATQTEGPPARASQPTSRHKQRYGGYPGEMTHSASSNRIALTFDAGASPAPTPSILKTLKSAGLHVTFFVTGKWCEQNPELVKEIAADGHEIGNHTYSHPDLRKLSDEAIVQQLSKADELITRLTGKSSKPLFRPPFGGRDKRVLSIAGEQGYTSVYWSLDSLDAFKKGITSQQIEDRILGRIQGGDIVLMHCGSAPTAAQLPDLISKLQQRGYEIVKASELMAGR
jgi:peptidoglycan/xylan/chitin deacetylase (PgdA/CDA1 family)